MSGLMTIIHISWDEGLMLVRVLRQTSSRTGDRLPSVRALHHQLDSMQIASLQASPLLPEGLANFEALQKLLPARPAPAAKPRNQHHPSKVLRFTNHINSLLVSGLRARGASVISPRASSLNPKP